MTRPEVRSRLGDPSRVVRSASQGQVLEQWIYYGSGKRTQYINFVVRAGSPQPIVQRSYSLALP